MNELILDKQGANFFGFERINSEGKHHFDLFGIKGNGDLWLTTKALFFNQWLTQKEYRIPIDKITKVEIKAWHNFKMKFPNKVLRIYFNEDDDIKIFGVSIGGNLSITKGWEDEAYLWKEKIESLLKK
jgi:hypothetical protein